MSTYYIPFSGDRPAVLELNGHRLVILSRSKGTVQEGLPLVGGERVERVRVGATKNAEIEAFTEIGRSANGGVVIAPGGLPVSDIIKNLEAQLPWLQ